MGKGVKYFYLRMEIALMLIFFIFIIPNILFGKLETSNFEFKHLSIIDGLSQNSVMSIYQDKYGYMWFATQDGLNKYDGKRFTVYKHSEKNPNSICSSITKIILETADGNLWVGTDNGGISRYRRETDDFENFTNDTKNKKGRIGRNVNTIYEDRKGILWIGTGDEGLSKFDRQNKIFTNYKYDPNNNNSISSNNVMIIFEDSEGNLWVGNSPGGLNKFERKTGNFKKYSYSKNCDIINERVNIIYENSPGILFVGTGNEGLKIFNIDKERYEFDAENKINRLLKNISIRAIFKGENKSLWIGSYNNGLFYIHKKNKKYMVKNYKKNIFLRTSLKNNKIVEIYKNREGLLFFGTIGGGVNILDLEMSFFKNYFTNPLLRGQININSVRAIFEDNNGNLLIGTSSDGLNILTDKEDRRLEIFGNNRILSINKDSFGRTWVGTRDDGLYYSDSDYKHFEKYPLKKKFKNMINTIRVIFEDKDKILWIGTQYKGLFRYIRDTNTFIRYNYDKENENSISNDNIRSITEDKEGNLWVGTWGGLNKFIKKKGKFIRYLKDDNKNSLTYEQILSVFVDKKNIVWVGTWGGGLYRYDVKKNFWKNYTEAEGFPNNVIYGILEEKDENPDPVLWMSSNMGLIKFYTKDEKIINYDSTSNIQANEFNGGAFFQNDKGEMYFGGVEGVTKFNPRDVVVKNYASKVQITGIKIFNEYKKFSKPVEELKELTLEYDENYFTIEFILLSYRSSFRNVYKYKLEGFDKDWIFAGDRNYAGYTNLSDGTYIFLVKGKNNGDWKKNETRKLIIKIIPPFWKTKLFIISSFFVLISLLYLLYKRRTDKIKKEWNLLQKTNERLNLEIAERKRTEAEKEILNEKLLQSEKMKTLGMLAGGVAHDLNNILGAIVSYPDIILMKLPMDSPLRKQVITIQKSGKRAAAVVKDLLTLARRGVKETKVLNLNNIIADMFESPEFISIRKENPDIVFNFFLDDNLLNLIGSEIQITKSLINLVLNAVEAIKDSEGQIFISTKNIEFTQDMVMTLSSIKEGKYVVFRILDNGEGISQEDIKRIFEPFYTKKKMGKSGTGLGMAIVEGMVADHRGEIDIWSEIGIGTSIDIYLPATDKKIEVNIDKKKISEYMGKGERILVIDDVNLQREIATMLLEQLNYKVETVSSGEEGIEFIKENEVDLVLLDMIMDPGIDGLTTYKRIMEIRKGQKVIIVSGFSKFENIEEIKMHGVDSYIGKPYTIDILGKSVKKVLNGNINE